MSELIITNERDADAEYIDDVPQRQPDGGTDAVECHKMSGKHDAQPERVAADIRQHAHQHKRQSVIQHRPPGHQL